MSPEAPLDLPPPGASRGRIVQNLLEFPAGSPQKRESTSADYRTHSAFARAFAAPHQVEWTFHYRALIFRRSSAMPISSFSLLNLYFYAEQAISRSARSDESRSG